MYRTIVCLADEHAFWALPLAGLVCWISCHTASRLLWQAREDLGRSGIVWLGAAAFAAGSGIWSTHFIAMLAYDPGVGVAYDLPLTLLSLALSINASLFSFAIARHAVRPLPAVAAGLVLGFGIAAVHYTGMAGIHVPGDFVWYMPLVATALVVGVVLACATFVVDATKFPRRPHVLAASLLTVAIVGLHFITMAAAEVVPDPNRSLEASGLLRGALAIGISVVMAMVLAFSILALFADRTRRANRALSEGQDLLREKTKLLDAVLENMAQGLMMIDAGGVVQVCNARAIALLDLPTQMMGARPTFEAVRQHQLAQHEFGKASEAMREWVANSGLELGAHTYERERPNGTVLEIRTAPLPDGGAVRTFTDVTQRRASEHTVQKSEARYRLLAENTSDVIVWCDLDTTRRYVSPASRNVFGYEPEELIGTRPLDFVHPDDVSHYQDVLADLTEGRTDQAVTMQRYRFKAGGWVWIEASFKLTRDPGGAPTGYVAALRNVTDRKAAEERLRLSEERLALALNSGSDGLWDWDLATGSIQFSDHWFGMLGYAPGEIEPHIRVWDDLVHPDDEERARRLMVEHVKGLIPTYECEYRMRRKTGGYVWTLARGKVVSRDETGRAMRIVGTHIDITRRKEAERQIAYMAMHDGLTGLANRALLHERLELALASAQRNGDDFAILACDLDRFKAVNDSFGHPAGDALLRVIADRLRAVVRDGDTVARLGGDEFAIILGSLDDLESASVFAQRVIEAVERPIDLDGYTAAVSISIGIALGNGSSPEADTLFKQADTALYQAKAFGRNGYRFYDPNTDAEVAKRSLLERDLRDAVRRGGFMLHYQPVVMLAGETVGGFEALLRWQHPTRGAISPAEFIPLAEETGLIVALGEWAICEACHEAASWQNELRVAVNVSAVQFQQPGLEQAVLNALIMSGLAPDRLELEITESMLMQDSEMAVASLHRLKALGVRIALDDFGTGYSSLSYLRRFPFDKIKIDRSFIGDIADPNTAAIVRAIVGIGAQLGASITAEGVETQQQLERVRQEGCTEVQGYFYSRPVSAGDALDFARATQRRKAA